MAEALEDAQVVDALARAVAEIQRLKDLVRERRVDVAISGMACRLPGGVVSPEGLWSLARSGERAIRRIPPTRWRPEDCAPLRSELSPATRWAGLLDDIETFDHERFGISPREAAHLDPQQTLVLEVAWDALQDAGFDPARLRGTDVGVFIGVMDGDALVVESGRPTEQLGVHTGPGCAQSFITGRLSHALGLRGPCMTLDTACSSSLVALHLAAAAIRRGECRRAIAGGVNVILSPQYMAMTANSGALSPDGLCRAFGEGANGFVRGEGCGVVVLERADDVLARRGRVWAHIAGSAVNHDGRSSRLTAPNTGAQVDVCRAALRDAGIEPMDVGCIEAHGTGTPLGDPIEIEALQRVYAARTRVLPVVVTALKPAIGHLEPAAGVAAVIRAVLALHHQEIPVIAGFAEPNPRLRLAQGLALATSAVAWPRSSSPRHAAVSGFGMSGTNAHVVVREPVVANASSARDGASDLLMVSGPTAVVARREALSLAACVQRHPAAFHDVAFTSRCTRAQHRQRIAVVGDRMRVAATATRAGDERALEVVEAREELRVAFAFAGQAVDVGDLAEGLLDAAPAFADAFTRCDTAAAECGGPRLVDAVRSSRSSRDTRLVQPLLFAFEYALAAMCRSAGLVPQLVFGHSLGEIVAACVAGGMSVEAGVRFACARGEVMSRTMPPGAMLAVATTPAGASDVLGPGLEGLSVSAYNGARSLVLGGDPDAITAARTRLTEATIASVLLPVDRAYHTSHVESALAELGPVLRAITPRTLRVPLLSAVDADLRTSVDGEYWHRHMRSPVRFAGVVDALGSHAIDAVLEIGPRPTLRRFGAPWWRGRVERCWTCAQDPAAGDAIAGWLTALGRLWQFGAPVRDTALRPRGRVTSLPVYEGCRTRQPRRPASTHTAPVEVALLDRSRSSCGPDGERRWVLELDDAEVEALAGHRVRGVGLVPAAMWFVLAIVASEATFGRPVALRDVTVLRALSVDQSPVVVIRSTSLFPSAVHRSATTTSSAMRLQKKGSSGSSRRSP